MTKRTGADWRKGLVAAAATVALLASQVALAAYTVVISEVGNDVVASGSGSLNLTALTIGEGGLDCSATVRGSNGWIAVGAGSCSSYAGTLSSTAGFGPGLEFLADAATGGFVAMYASLSQLDVPGGYVSGAPLGSSTATWNNRTLASLGLTPGTYTWTWGSGPTTDSFTLIVGNATSVPALSEWSLISISLLLAGWGMSDFARRRS